MKSPGGTTRPRRKKRQKTKTGETLYIAETVMLDMERPFELPPAIVGGPLSTDYYPLETFHALQSTLMEDELNRGQALFLRLARDEKGQLCRKTLDAPS